MSQTAFASDAALVVQGLLIFSAAIVGVIGYYVQSKLAGKARQREIVAARKEHLRQLELARVREKLDTFIGPVSHLFHSFSSQLLELMSVLGKQYWPEIFKQHQELFQQKGGWPVAFQGTCGMVFSDGMFLDDAGTAVSKQLTDNPTSNGAKLYRKSMARLISDYALPLANLIKTHAGYLQEWTSGEDFKKAYPHYAKNPMARNLFFVQFQHFAYEFRDVIQDWETGDYTVAWPVLSHYSYHMWTYASQMITRIREKENQYGTADHSVTRAEDDVKIIKTRDPNESYGVLRKKKSSSKTKYVLAVGAATVGAAAATVSGGTR
jgi:hypothetical protein